MAKGIFHTLFKELEGEDWIKGTEKAFYGRGKQKPREKRKKVRGKLMSGVPGDSAHIKYRVYGGGRREVLQFFDDTKNRWVDAKIVSKGGRRLDTDEKLSRMGKPELEKIILNHHKFSKIKKRW